MKTAYLDVELDPSVIAQLTQGLTLRDDRNACFSHPLIAGIGSQVVQLVKALPELWQLVSAWHATLDKRLTSIHMHRYTKASAVYSYGNSSSQVFHAAWIDYLTFVGKEHDLENLYSYLDSLFELKILRNAQYLLGIEITRRKKIEVLLIQKGFVNKILQAHGIELCTPHYMAVDIGAVTVLAACSEEKVLDDTGIVTYQSLVGLILYASIVI